VPRRTKADPVAQALGVAVRRVRQERGETLEEVDGRIPRIDAKYLGEIERGGHAPSITTVKKLAVALQVSVAELVRDL
jgi:XRE family transcriptional regulator, regulator of sulfur utilization